MPLRHRSNQWTASPLGLAENWAECRFACADCYKKINIKRKKEEKLSCDLLKRLDAVPRAFVGSPVIRCPFLTATVS
ncbi:hypothetical protein TNCV_4724621 [Trichonephila clavipes]|uniref:Uncharacterized protein n=1 Tax=Trichonephila clavipes TaxID=2585209 RepID=A0A8X6W703_TRICX|nr:hypothetical protein TNCV_4724621 [Trichonephila clavipes]